MNKALVIFSGGQDSTTCLYWAKKNFDKVDAITFMYGQKHRVELGCAREICVQEKINQVIVDLSFLNQIVESAMINNGNTSVLNKKGLPASFVPNRNQLFITLAHSYAQKIGAEHLVTGVCQTDYNGYPDCRSTFIVAMQSVSNAGSDAMITIHTPLMFKTKAQTFKMAEDLGCLKKVIEVSHTCYEGDHSTYNDWGYGCGICPACELRKKGWIEYQSSSVLQP